VIPRWEWRTFGREFGEGEERLSALEGARVVEGRETYILPPMDGVNVKIRGGALDIKLLRAVNESRLERWEPVFKAPFPLSHDEVARLFSTLRLPEEPVPHGEYDEERFLSEVIAGVPALRAVPVTKKRFGHVLRGAALEWADLVVDGHPVRTVCVEHEDAALVSSLVREFGFERFENLNYIRAIRKIVEGERV
jgi:exopolyphosphatase/guanosine-5'-triphosphate,3'-diphosphate pyrophosphatase